MTTKYLTCAETAKLVRQALKEAFGKGCTFSVTSSTYSGGASISVRWTDGPNETQVDSVVGHLKGSYFDSSIDFKGSVYHLMDGQQVSMGADYIHLTRSSSVEAVERAIGAVHRRFAGNFAAGNTPRPTASDFNKGDLWHVRLHRLHDHGGNLQTEINQVLHKHTFVLKVLPSSIAKRIFVTHDDNYSMSHGSGMSAVPLDE